MSTKTLTKSISLKELDKTVDAVLQEHFISPKTGFLSGIPLRHLPSGDKRSEYFKKIDDMGYSLEKNIKQKNIANVVKTLPVPNFEFNDLSREVIHRLMLVIAMNTHAYFKETLQYKDVSELMKDASTKSLPAQLAVPLWKLSKLTGIAPSMSYGLYSLWNYYKKDENQPISLDNINMIHTFSDTLDERWFVWIHQVVEVTLAPAIKELTRAYYLVSFVDASTEEIIKELIQSLDKASTSLREVVNVLERMREHCNYKTYFDSVRLYYAFPKRVIFEGVDELKCQPQEIFGETGGQSPYMHFVIKMLGIDHSNDQYFPYMKKHLSGPYRDFILSFEESKIRDYVLQNKKNRVLVRRYNMLVQSVLDWRAEHISLVDDFIKQFGEFHGTGKPPLEWLKDLYNRTKDFLIDI